VCVQACNFNFLSHSITKLAETTNLLSETIKVNGIQNKLSKIIDLKGNAVKQKFRLYFNKNKGFVMCRYSYVLRRGRPGWSCKPEDVERTFSQHIKLFLDSRHKFTKHNLKMTFVVHGNIASPPVSVNDNFS
jgi:hypothetical protein